MSKPRLQYVCTNCGTALTRWEGKCPSCKQWDTLEEQLVNKQSTTSSKSQLLKTSGNMPVRLDQIKERQHSRIAIPNDGELERVLGGGIVPGAITLIGGQPGIGKSTLMLQVACQLPLKVLYVSGEESAYQIKMRATRITKKTDNCLILCETQLEKILHHVAEQKPDILLIDSIQTIQSIKLDSPAGSVSQIRECTFELQQYAKQSDIPVFIIGHITKDGSLAGPKLLEHIVDVVLQFEGDRNYVYRILRTIKNRFGSTDEIGIYEMESFGLRPVTNPSELLISPGDEHLSGTSIASTIEGVRPLLIETQALVTPLVYGQPQRSATGFDNRRLNMLLAVLEKKCNLYFSQQDVFLNIAGGIKVSDPAIDLSIVSSLISSLHDIPIDKKICLAGEIGLSGEVRAVNRIDQRIHEADRLGFNQIIISKYHKKGIPKDLNIQVKMIGKISELLEILFT